jgi:hypothetical protein
MKAKPFGHGLRIEDQEQRLMPVRVFHGADQDTVHVVYDVVLVPV